MSLPTGWTLASLGELVTLQTGPFGSSLHQSDYVTGGTPIVNPMHIRGGRIRPSAEHTVAAQTVERLSDFKLHCGDIVIGRRGEMGRCAVVTAREQGWLCGTGSMIIRCTAALLPAFLQRLLTTRESVDFLGQESVGSTMANLNQKILLGLPVRLPPMAEQQRIVDALEASDPSLDDAVAELATAKRKLALYRQSLLKSAVEGTLTHEWRQHAQTKETGEVLLARLLRERQARWEARQLTRSKAQGKSAPRDWRDRYEPGATPDTSNLPTLPDGWVYASIGQCFEVAVGATPSRKAAEYWGGGVPWVSSGEVSFNRITATRESISETGLANSSTQINPAGSVLLGMIGEGKTRGQVAILDIPAANNQNCAAIWVSETDLPPEFVYFWLWSRYNETRRGSSGNNQPALNKSLVQAMPVPIAPIEEMREIAERLGVQFAGIEAQKREIDRLLRLASAQRQNILRAAFSGQLVPQDPNDEPASLLLERIRTHRAAAASAGRVRVRGRAAKGRA